MLGFTQSGAINVFNKSLVDVSDLAKQVGDAHGGWVEPLSSNIGQFEGVWRGVPGYFIDFPANYRKDRFDNFDNRESKELAQIQHMLIRYCRDFPNSEPRGLSPDIGS